MSRSNDSKNDEVLTVALVLQAERDAQRTAARAIELERLAIHEAAAELGIDHDQLARAETIVERRRGEAQRRRSQRGRTFVAALLTLLGVGLGTVAWAIAAAPPDPWSLRPQRPASADDTAPRWDLATNPGTMALLRWKPEGGREVAMVSLDFVSQRDTRYWFVDLDGVGLPPIEGGHERVTVALSGTLPHARLCLMGGDEYNDDARDAAGPTERWCSPVLTVTPTWHSHALRLDTLEHERLERGRWRTQRSRARLPSDVTGLSLRLGRDVNPSDAMGVIRIGEVRVE